MAEHDEIRERLDRIIVSLFTIAVGLVFMAMGIASIIFFK